MENPQQEAIGHLQGRLEKAFAGLDSQILLTPFQNHVRHVQLLWGFHIKIMGVQKLHEVLEKLWGVLLSGGDWWGNGNCRGVFSLGSFGRGSI